MMNMIFGIWVLLQAALPPAPGNPLDAQAKPSAAEAQDPDRPAISAVDLKALKENNVFAPHTQKRRPSTDSSRTKTSRPPTPPSKPKPPFVTGIFFDVKSQDYLVIVEDRNEASQKYFKEPKFLKVGDEVLGVKVQSVSSEKAVFLKGDVSKDARVGDSMPETDAKPLSGAVPSEDPDLADEDDPAALPAASKSKSSLKGEVPELKPEAKSTDTRPSDAVLEELRKKNGMKRKNRPGE